MKAQLIKFLEDVQEMRRLQNQYFKSRDKGVLIRSKQKEIEIDQQAPKLLEQLKGHEGSS